MARKKKNAGSQAPVLMPAAGPSHGLPVGYRFNPRKKQLSIVLAPHYDILVIE